MQILQKNSLGGFELIKRDYYLSQLVDRIDNGLVKIITGIRRCGKSYLLLNIFRGYLISKGIDEKNIICIELDRRSFIALRNPDKLYEYVVDHISSDEKYYIFIDEIQMCNDFESVLNDFLHISNLDIYVTGSNSKLLSKDIITEFRGRGDEIHLNPLSFKEFYSSYSDFETAWNDYYTYGGMPLVLTKKNDEDKMKYLRDLFSETYIKDIKERNKIKNDNEFEQLLNIISSSIGSLTNPTKLVDTFKSVSKISISPNTIKDYLEYLEDSYLIRKSLRYDVKGKKYINTPSKYYFTDLGLRNARLNFRQQEENHIMENIIYNELCIRGYSVDVGVVEINERQPDGKYIRKQLECDFVINKGNTRYYIQSAYEMPNEEKGNQEKKSLINIEDSFKKVIIVKDNIKPKKDENGILTIGLKDFLLNDDSINI